MDIQEANSLLSFLDESQTIQRFIAQAKSRYILLNVGESRDNFPDYVPDLNFRNNHTAFSYLTVGCYLAELGEFSMALNPLKVGASLLEYNHKPVLNREVTSNYYLLTASLAYYASFEYSKAFVVLDRVEYDTIAGRIFSLFLKKKYIELLSHIDSILLTEILYPQGEDIKFEDIQEYHQNIYNKLLATSTASLLEYFYSGDEAYILKCKDVLSDLLELLSADEEPSMWWTVRLFSIIIDGLDQSSIWKILPPLFPQDKMLSVSSLIKSLSLRQPVPIVELFISQRGAVQKSLGENGVVICLPTSGGKTRVAEITIFETITRDDDNIVLYIAPFRSLAYEIEQSLSSTFMSLGIKVSHLYGGSQFSKVDKMQLVDAKILIATPEKAKALLRADESIATKIKLVVLDEGHLIGNQDRLIRNEMFFEELRHHIKNNDGKFLVLSAVLPNAHDIAEWVTKERDSVYSNTWKPSTRRLGVLEFTGVNVNINWLSEEPETWNYRFVDIKRNEEGAIVFPKTKREAVAATAVKLSNSGSVLIFHTKSTQIIAQAKECVFALGNSVGDYEWNNSEAWESFELATKQSLGDDCDLLKFAKYGILCHYRKIPNDVKICLERLMRQSNPRIIISTTTLAQGVNLGVSTVIIADIWFDYPGGSKLPVSSFWNIVGRAGRAFIDSEGKVLVAIEQKRDNFLNDLEKKTAKEYLLNENYDEAISGVLLMIIELERISHKSKIDFSLLLELIAENYEEVETKITEAEFHELQNKLDLIDDTLLSLNHNNLSWLDADSSNWIDSFFRESLSYIQAKNNISYNEDVLIQYLKKRNQILLEKIGDVTNWKNLISTGIPLRASIKLLELIPSFEAIFNEFTNSAISTETKLAILSKVEDLIYMLPGSDFIKKNKIGRSRITDSDRYNAKKLWITGISFKDIEETIGALKANYFCNDFYTFIVPWVLNAIARKFAADEKIVISEFYENLSVELELGVPSILASKIYLCGIRSRSIATEISFLFQEVPDDITINDLTFLLVEKRTEIETLLSTDAVSWLRILKNGLDDTKLTPVIFRNFTIPSNSFNSKKLIVRNFNDKIYLCSPDYSENLQVLSTEKLPFGEVANMPGIAFVFDESQKIWKLESSI